MHAVTASREVDLQTIDPLSSFSSKVLIDKRSLKAIVNIFFLSIGCCGDIVKYNGITITPSP
jgi:hypothetical protein